MDRRVTEFIARRMEGPNRNDSDRDAEIEYRRRRRSDGTFMESTHDNEPQSRYENEYRSEATRGIIDTRNRGGSNKGPDDDERRRIGFGQGEGHKSHWSEEEFLGDMEESLYHEVDDIFHYIKIMEKVYEKGYDKLASAFYDIANEKYVCAEFLKGHLKKMGMFDSSEHKRLEKDLKEVGKMFK